jgi:hypothetical protein
MTVVQNVSSNPVRLSDGSNLAPGAQRDVVVGSWEIHAINNGWLEDLSGVFGPPPLNAQINGFQIGPNQPVANADFPIFWVETSNDGSQVLGLRLVQQL